MPIRPQQQSYKEPLMKQMQGKVGGLEKLKEYKLNCVKEIVLLENVSRMFHVLNCATL